MIQMMTGHVFHGLIKYVLNFLEWKRQNSDKKTPPILTATKKYVYETFYILLNVLIYTFFFNRMVGKQSIPKHHLLQKNYENQLLALKWFHKL